MLWDLREKVLDKNSNLKGVENILTLMQQST